MFSDTPFPAFALLSREFYESLDNYKPDPADFEDVVRSLVPDEWILKPGGFWTSCLPANYSYLDQGWKIHLSAVPQSATELLRRSIPALTGRQVAFKFVSDRRMLGTSLSKTWSRSGAGKFMTVYPRSDEEFLSLIDELHRLTAELQGPFVLSDRPFPGSKVVFYRYGGHRPRSLIDANGFSTSVIEAPDGSLIPDERTGAFRLPPWVQDLVSQKAPLANPGSDGVLLHDRYRVSKALRFNASGGIYRAFDTHTGREVVIREARPMLGSFDEADSFNLLRKEARILERLTPVGVLPEFVDLFQEWEHLFLVQESIAAESLWGHAVNYYFGGGRESPDRCFAMYRETCLKLIRALRRVHDNGVILRDLTRSNTLVTPEGKIRFIDLEFAYDLTAPDRFFWVQTPGYASPEQLRAEVPSFQDDHYSLGVLMLDIATFSASGLDLNREGILAALELMLTDLRLPPAIGELIRGLVAVDRRDRWDLDRAEKFLLNITPPNDDAPLFNPLGYALHSRAPSRELRLDVADTVAGISRFILSKSRLGRRDSLWPSSPEVFLTNPVNLQYGAAGTAYFLLRSNGFVPDEVLDWIFEVGRRSTCPPGLARGYSGTALLLLEAGRHEQAKAMLELGAGSPILEQESGLYLGSSGWGLVQLHFWHRLGESQYLTSALEIGKQLADSAREMPEGVVWTRQSRHSHGLFDGPSGVALFLIYLAAASGDNSFLDLARRALSFDLANRRESGADLLWYPYLNSPPSEPLSPHLWFGTAGIGAALIRAWAVTGDPELLAWAKRCAATVANRYTNKIWYDFGLSGYGELQLDFYHFLGEQQYLQTAWHLSEAILPHRVSKPEGYVFAGRDFHRLCCDLGWGSAGIGIFLNRLLEPATPRLFMLDDLLSESLRRRDRATVTQAAELAERK